MPEINKLIYRILKILRDSMSADEFDPKRLDPDRSVRRRNEAYGVRSAVCQDHSGWAGVHGREQLDAESS